MYSKLHLSRQVAYCLALLALASVAGCPVNQDTAPPHPEAGQNQAAEPSGPAVRPPDGDDDPIAPPAPPAPPSPDPDEWGPDPEPDPDPDGDPEPDPGPDPEPDPGPEEIELLWASISSGATVTDAAVLVVGEFAAGVASGDGIVLQHGIVPCITAP